MGFIKEIKKNTPDSHQTSPAYVLTFTRWRNRDTINYKAALSTTTRTPLVVVNDAVNINIQNSKSSPTPTFSCTLKQGDLNYLTAIHPGDYVIVNMVNWKDKAMEIRGRALKSQPINKVDDGFKGLFKILDVRMILSVSSGGIKQYNVQVTARGFDEFNNVLYFNPATNNKDNDLLFINNFKNFIDLLKKKEENNVQNLVKEVIKRTIGVGIADILPKNMKLNQIPAYKVPPQVAALLNRKKDKAQYISEINNYYLGIWSNKVGSKGFADFFTKDKEFNFYKTEKELPGARSISVMDFSNIKVWSLLTDYANTVLNEAYTCYRLDPEGKYVYPSLIVRQKPFNTRHYEKFANSGLTISPKNASPTGADVPHTKFLDLPRWKISPDLITSLSLGRSDSGRINFVQVFTRSLAVDNKFDQAAQIALGNFIEDKGDVDRSGRKPYVVTCNFDFAGSNTEHRARKWSRLVADWVFNGHLKMNGTIQSIGIEEPICIGDNLEFDNIVYHIESVNHNMVINNSGLNVFRTNISLSMGVSESSTKQIPVYAEMDHTDSFTRRLDDQANDKREHVLPGFSDTQDLPSRVLGEEVEETRQATFTNPKLFNKGKKRKD